MCTRLGAGSEVLEIDVTVDMASKACQKEQLATFYVELVVCWS